MNTATENRTIQPYLFFNGSCEQAIEFYRKALGAEVLALTRFKDSPEPPNAECGPVPPDKVMHATFRIGNTDIMASDGQCTGKTNFDGFSLSLSVTNETEAEKLFRALTDGGQVCMPLTQTFFSPRFGMVKDRFGIMWMIYTIPAGGKK